jgi:DNA modification methylase
VKPAKGNTRVHPPEQITEIMRSIEEFGWTKPIIVDEKREILAGHGAYQAALQMGMTEVPIIQRAGLSQAQKRAYRTADNKIGENSAWDTKLLATELGALKDMGFDMTLTGFKPGEIEALLRPPPSHHPEPVVPDQQGPTITKPGDVWAMGEHRLICADSTKPATYETLMDGRQAALVFTDPPYSVSYETTSGKFEQITGDGLRRGQLTKMLHGAFAAALKHTTQDAAWYVWHACWTRADFADAMRDIGLVELSYIIWVKPGMTPGWGNYQWAHEPCFYAARQGATPAHYGDRTQTTVWEAAARTKNGVAVAIGSGIILSSEAGELQCSQPQKGKSLRHQNVAKGETVTITLDSDQDNVWRIGRGKEGEYSIHPTQKPVELARRAIKNSSREREIVLDFFAGSGSTLIACEQLARACYAVEIDPRYCDAIIHRWEGVTGKKAIHAEEKKTHEAITKARGKEKARAA